MCYSTLKSKRGAAYLNKEIRNLVIDGKGITIDCQKEYIEISTDVFGFPKWIIKKRENSDKGAITND